jgi:hypothetical protein
VGRRTKEQRDRGKWPDKRTARSFGYFRDERHPEEWEQWLKKDAAADASSRLDELVQAGCERTYLVRLLMELHVSRDWRTFSSAELKVAVKALHQAEHWLARLGGSDLQFELGLTRLPGEQDPAKFESVYFSLAEIRRLTAKQAEAANRRESRHRNRLLAGLVRYVQWATGEPHDGEVTELVGAVLDQETFSMSAWRWKHPELWNEPSKLENGWNQAVSEGRRQPPTVENAKKRRQGHRVMSEAHRAK